MVGSLNLIFEIDPVPTVAIGSFAAIKNVVVPSPIKYQSSFAPGTPGPGLRSLIDELLAKLRSVDAIGEEEYRRALGEPIVVAGGRPPG
jgi:hypothetical protein